VKLCWDRLFSIKTNPKMFSFVGWSPTNACRSCLCSANCV